MIKRRPFPERRTDDNHRVGRRIRVPEVRVIGADAKQIGVIPTHEALAMADALGLELVEVDPRAKPPVCRILDYGKFKYETSKKEKASRKHQSTVLVKEIKLRPKTDTHDFEFKLAHIKRFLGEGNKCKLVVVFRGREIVHPETGEAMLSNMLAALGDLAQIEQRPSLEGKRMVMIIGARAGLVRPKPAVGPAPSPGPSTPASAAPASASAAPASASSAQALPAPTGPSRPV
jgi:translation initiation factor IF-3